MEYIKNEEELLKRLKSDIEISDKNTILFLAGHFPLVYGEQEFEGLHKWGEFSTYTLELACVLGQYARGLNREVKFVFFVDDHIYENRETQSTSEIKTKRRNLYKLRSGDSASLPEEYRAIMSEHGFSENDVLRQDHNKPGRRDCLYFSEKILRASDKEITNDCAREYLEFLANTRYFDKENTHLIAFIPSRCEENICNFALSNHLSSGVSASHIFVETMNPDCIRKDLYNTGRGVTYRKD